MLDRLFESASQRWHMVLPEAPGQRRCCRKDHGSMSSAMIMRPGRWIRTDLKSEGYFFRYDFCVLIISLLYNLQPCVNFERCRHIWVNSGKIWCDLRGWHGVHQCSIVQWLLLCHSLACCGGLSMKCVRAWQVIKLRRRAYAWYALICLTANGQYWRPTFFAVRWRWMKLLLLVLWLMMEEARVPGKHRWEECCNYNVALFPLIAVVDDWRSVSFDLFGVPLLDVAICSKKMCQMPYRNISILEIRCRSKLPRPLPNCRPNCMRGRVESPLMPGLIGWLRG